MLQDPNKELLHQLFAMTFQGIKPGLERIQQMLQTLNNPHLLFPVIHVAGTNGKGSTSSILASVLRSAGYKVGLYTSPHIVSFNERIKINAENISDSDVARLASPLMEEARQIGGTFFEVTTAMAFQYFAEQRVDVAVIEVGMGGRLDATNVVEPILSVITAIDLDHTEYLGNTIAKIAAEKGGIIKCGIPVIVSEQSPHHRAEVYKTLTDIAEKINSQVVFADDVVKVEIDHVHPDLSMSVSVIDDDFLHYYNVDIAGAHQAANVATVLAAIPFLQRLYFINADQLRYGIEHVREQSGLYGRVTLINKTPTTVLDVSHNPAGITTLANTLSAAGYVTPNWNVVFGAMQDKDVAGMLKAAAVFAGHFHLCTPKIARAASVDELEKLLTEFSSISYTVHASVADAFRSAQLAGPTIVCGSFHVADEVLTS
ncbi:MAG: bifunctional folylpolyglutamate synthase/dihydrofolate synthase [Ignavibacteria bacterium]|nr:bifunctional folylpolyglutamate synthase/dihydrofolate synthase [Ignavibacteria bacterium]